MSRTYKHKRRRHFSSYWTQDHILVEGFGWRLTKTTKPKLRKKVDTEDHWMSTPSWWNNLFHTKPKRGKFRNFSKLAVKSSILALDDMLEPSDSNKPHKYFY